MGQEVPNSFDFLTGVAILYHITSKCVLSGFVALAAYVCCRASGVASQTEERER